MGSLRQNKVKFNRKLDLNRLPKHIAIIMDGNGRWATHRGLPRNMGHKAGFENIKRIVEHIYNLGIHYVTFFTFSTENWKRPKEEINGIFGANEMNQVCFIFEDSDLNILYSYGSSVKRYTELSEQEHNSLKIRCLNKNKDNFYSFNPFNPLNLWL